MNTWHDIETFHWMGYDWIKRPLWGLNHPDDDFTYYDESQAWLNDENELILEYKYFPKWLPMRDGSIVEKPYGRASVRCTEEFKYGVFEWDMKCPYGRYQWPALWLASDHSWPPEIDCMEGWSDKCPNYVKRILFRNIHPTMHWGTENEHKQEGKKNNWIWNLKCGKNFDHYKVVWTPTYIDVYYNGHKFGHFTNPEMLEQMNKKEVKMHPIMSTGPYRPFSMSDYVDYIHSNEPMVVRSFKYTPLDKMGFEIPKTG